MSKSGLSHHWYKHGLYAGYNSYRHGGSVPRKLKTEQIYKGDKRKHMIQLVMESLQDWRLSQFENEGPIRSGLRSALCARGYSWDQADNEASTLISAAFTFLGYARPTWDQGQREYVTPREHCSWCNCTLPERLVIGDRPLNFCSDICAQAAWRHREYKYKSKESKAYLAAYHAICLARIPERECEQCGVTFKPMLAGVRFCSHKCKGDSYRSLFPKPCQQCGTQFRPNRSDSKFCSNECMGLSYRTLETKNCLHCGKEFRPDSEKTMFCSRKCMGDSRRVIPEKQCFHCSCTFKPSNKDAKFCSQACREAGGHTTTRYYFNCEWCGVAASATLSNARCCSQACAKALWGITTGKRVPKRLSAPVFDYLFKQAA